MTAESAAHLDLSSLLKTPKILSADMSPSSGSLDFKELKFMKRIIILGKKKQVTILVQNSMFSGCLFKNQVNV